ncbi:MAG: hypothetical protein H6767_02840 [Candidatus Peribacteria bacterium]|nr:MAG: hypothetical protein H6767_02840 [Candidatus Peribacteria bacterium]
MNEIQILKSLYAKQAILYTINLYLEEENYKIDEDEKNYIITLDGVEDSTYKLIKEELTFNALRFEISDRNKELRKSIISQALGSINVE